RPAAEGSIIHLVVFFIRRPVADVPAVDFYQALFQGQLQDALAEKAVKDLGKQRENIEANVAHANHDTTRRPLSLPSPKRREGASANAVRESYVAAGAACLAAAASAACCSAFFKYFLNSTAHFSDGKAPTRSQCFTRSG